MRDTGGVSEHPPVASAKTSLEIERKYEAAAHLSVPNLVGVSGITSVAVQPGVQLEARYFDTAELDLAQRVCALRYRTGGKDAGWHLKARVAEGVRETQWPLPAMDASDAAIEQGGAALPQPVRAAILDFIDDKPLEVIATISTERAIHLLFSAEAEQPIAELADDIVTTTDARTGRIQRWREWEVELLGEWDAEDAETFFAEVERAIITVGAEPSKLKAKLQRALGQG